jgi:hypothetical protein
MRFTPRPSQKLRFFVAVCCSVLQCVAVRCGVIQCFVEGIKPKVEVSCSVLQYGVVCCSVLQCVSVRCSVFPRVAA